MKTFTTSYGTRIEVIDGYKELHPQIRLADVVTPYAELVPDRGWMGIDGFIKDVYEYAIMIDFLERLGARTFWERGLDIGGAEGTISRLLRGARRLRYAVTIDISDVSRSLSTSTFIKHFLRFRAACLVARYSAPLRRFLLGDGEWRGQRLTPLFNNWGYWPPRSSTFWRLSLRAVPRIDRYIVGDVYQLDERFDLVTAFFCLDYFDIERVFAKIASLLVEGGTFFFAVSYWWYPVNSTGIVGGFPYCCQRLTPDDVRRYFEQFHPEEVEDVMRRYQYFHCGVTHPTLNDFVEIADRYDLALIGSDRLSPPRDVHHRSVLTPRLLNQFGDSRLDRVLADLHRVRPDVGLIDLQTAYVMAAFEKRSRSGRRLAEHLRSHELKERVREIVPSVEV